MNIPVKVWIKYRDTLARINRKAYDDMTAFLDRIGGYGGSCQSPDCWLLSPNGPPSLWAQTGTKAEK